MIKRVLYTLLLLFSYNFVYCQTNISGKIFDTERKPIISASIILKDETEKIVTYTFSDAYGNYILHKIVSGQYSLTISALGYEKIIKKIDIYKNSEVQTFDFTLSEKISEIKEVIIKSERPITIEGDKITFNANSFLQGNEQTVEDLLKNIPGINVEEDGTIKVGNQEVEKVMVDGDDFFEKGYKVLTKNMPVNPIDTVELLQKYSNNKHLKGIENSNKVALNLTLKDDAKSTWFGNATAGYDILGKNRYEAKGNLMNFGKKNKYYFLTNFNNVGSDTTGNIYDLIYSSGDAQVGNIGNGETAENLLGLGFDRPNLKEKRVNFNNAKLLSINSIFTLADKIKLKLLGFGNADENSFFRNSFESFSVGNTNFENTENFEGRKKQLTGFGKVDFTYDISKNKTLEYTGKFNKTSERNTSDLLFNKNLLNERLNSDNQLVDQKIVFTNKFKENKVFLLSGRYINEKTPQNYVVNQFLFSNYFQTDADKTKQFSQNKMQFAGVEAHLLDRKKNGDLLEVKIGNQLRIDHLDTRFELFKNENLQSTPRDFQNNLTYSTNDLYLTTKYRFKFEKFSLLTEANFHQFFNQLENPGVKSAQNPFFIIPTVGFDWEINKKNKLLASYTYNTSNAQVLDVYSGLVQTGFRSFSKGLQEFNLFNSSNVILNYTYGSWGDKFFANMFVIYNKDNDFYSTNSIIAQNFSQSEKILIKDRELLSVSSNADRYFKPIKSNLKLILGASKSNYKNIVNNSDLREVKNLNFNYGFELRSGFKGFFNYHFGSKWNHNQVKTTITNSFTDNLSFLDLSLIFNDKFNIQLQSERYYFGNLEKGTNQYYFLDAEARYVIKENKITLFLSGNNLFNVNTFRNYSISDISISETEYRLQPRYVMLKAEYRF